MRVLSDADVARLLDLETLLDVAANGLRAQGRGDVERPERPHFPVGQGRPDARGHRDDAPLGTALVMPAYVHGAAHYATKVAGVHDGNVDRDLPTVNASITLTAADTGLPVAIMAGTRLTNARTGCIGGLAARELAATEPVSVGVIGAGEQARWQTRAIAAGLEVDSVRVYSPSDSRNACAADLRAAGIDAEAVGSPTDAVSDADVVVTATTATEPVFDGDDLREGTLVVAVGAYTPTTRELDDRTVERATSLFADVPEEAAATGDFPNHGPENLTPLSAVLEGTAGRRDPTDVIVVASVGTAVLDAAVGEHVYERAIEEDVGVEMEF